MRSIKYISLTIGIFILGFSFSCRKMDETYRKFVVPGGLLYIGKAENVTTNAGRERVKITWTNKDPKAKMARIYWNNKADSIDVAIPPADINGSTSVIINNLAEGSYVFQIFTFDDAQNKSISVEAIANSYDTLYERSLNNRVITPPVTKVNDTAVVKILSLDSTAIGTQFTYLSKAGVVKDTLMRTIAETTIKLPLMNLDTVFTYKTLYLPRTSIDTFYTTSKRFPR